MRFSIFFLFLGSVMSCLSDNQFRHLIVQRLDLFNIIVNVFWRVQTLLILATELLILIQRMAVHNEEAGNARNVDCIVDST